MPIGDLLAQITGSPAPVSALPSPTAPPKRKADDDLRKVGDKLQRLDQSTTHPTRPRPSATTQSNTQRPTLASRAQPSSSTVVSNKPMGQNFTQTKAPAAAAAPAKPPKKGSFADTMARAKAAQANLGQVGKIQHKPVERMPSKKEREMQKTGVKKGVGSQVSRDPSGDARRKGQALPARNGLNGRGTNGRETAKAAPEPVKKVKKAATATTGYTGTARPNPAAMKKTAPPARPQSQRPAYRSRSPDYDAPRRYRYAASDEEEEEDGEEEEGYGSDGSSDMEAAAFEVDEEEEAAARIARREDELALKEENRLKEEKRRRLAALAAKNRR